MSVSLLEDFDEELNPDINTTVPEYLQRIATALSNEQEAIKEYDYILKTSDLPEELRSVLEEIRNDEQDHMVLISDIVNKYTIASFQNNTEELKDIPDPETELSLREGNPVYSIDSIKKDIEKGTRSSSYELWDDDYLKLLSYLRDKDDYVSELGDKRGTLVFVNGKKQITVSRNNIDIEVV